MLIKKKLLHIIELQHTLNQQINPQWLDENYAFDTAILIESAELVDSFAWKWWKAGANDIANAKVEVVDIMHFLVSYCLMFAYKADPNTDGLYSTASAYFLDMLKCADTEGAFATVDEVANLNSSRYIAGVKLFISKLPSVAFNYAHNIGVSSCPNFSLKSLCRTFITHLATPLFSSADEMLNMYIAKNMLNKLRQNRGYKQGTYIKQWLGREDNEVVMELVAANVDAADVTLAELYNLIDAYYIERVAVNV